MLRDFLPIFFHESNSSAKQAKWFFLEIRFREDIEFVGLCWAMLQ